mmetsp:Transcript_23828/g.36830  ORF Transcript_23828/g.36830 Transcript_23828/m.36830 type:complete len:344 (+) Transcript_23828:84-1115(+)
MNATTENVLEAFRQIGLDVSKDDVPEEYETMKRASVLIPLFLRNSRNSDGTQHKELHMLLTQRNKNLRSHGGEVCFPGGKQDAEDQKDDIVTALRETTEETGLHKDLVEPLCRLRSIEKSHGLCVTPIVGYIENSTHVEPTNLSLSEGEVEAAFVIPVSYFVDDANCHSKKDIEWRGETFVMRTFYYKAECQRTFKIWGLTAHFAHHAATIAAGTTKSLPLQIQSKDYPILEGYLFRLETPSNETKPYWSKRFYVFTETMLHQYDNKLQATRKASSANKKNRLALVQSEITLVQDGDTVENNDEKTENRMYEFIVSVLQGRIQWRLGTSTKEERNRWIMALEK